MQGDNQGSWIEEHKGILVFAGVLAALLLVSFFFFIAFKMLNSPKSPAPKEEKAAKEKEEDDLEKALSEKKDKKSGSLPSGEERDNGDENGDGELSGLEVENMGFGDFYKAPDMDIKIGFDDISLPMNVKVDVANYHDVNRKIDLEAGLESLNENGFAVLDNPFASEADDFYSMYDHLDRKQLPTMITADFLIYYYQNTLKSVYKEIESTTFYDNLWETNLKLYKIAKARYEKHKDEAGLVNDPTLEAERLELIFFATALKLLQPSKEQINREATLEASDMFSVGEANHYSFQVPDYLKDNVNKEESLIKEAQGIHKSPILLYDVDYSRYRVPEEYLDSSRLKNFYLASRWLNSVFPLYYRSDECPDCLLDKDDWRINFHAALILAQDFAANQDLQNRWAKIYKLKSFFKGLRSDLTYLHYKKVFEDLFGEEKKVLDEFSGEKNDIDKKLKAIQSKLLSFNFLDIEGAIDKKATSSRPLAGMKMLAGSYWPNDYIKEELTYPKVGHYLKTDNIREAEDNTMNTLCDIDRVLYRCFFSVYDIINIIYPIYDTNSYFAANTEYENYHTQKESLERQLEDFDQGTWHSNSYWSTLDIARNFLDSPNDHKPAYAGNRDWVKRKVNTVAGSWVNLQSEADILTTYRSSESGMLGQAEVDNKFAEYRYAEPNYALISELLANSDMLLEMFSALNVTEKDNQAVFKLKAMEKDLERTAEIIKKEIAGEALSEDDYKFLGVFSKEFSVKREAEKKMVIDTEHSREELVENLEGVKLLVATYRKNGKNIFAIGPVFNFWEDKD